MAVADKKGLQMAGNRGERQGGKPRATAPRGNPLKRTPQNKAVADKKGGRPQGAPNRSPRSAGGARHLRAERTGGARNGRRGGAPLLAQSHATNPEQGQNADVGRDGGSVAPPLVEPLEQIKEAVADTDNARNGDEMERQRRQNRQSDGGAQAHVEPVGTRGRARQT